MFQIRGQPQMKWDTLCLVPVDNLTSNILGGFKEGSIAHIEVVITALFSYLTFSQYTHLITELL